MLHYLDGDDSWLRSRAVSIREFAMYLDRVCCACLAAVILWCCTAQTSRGDELVITGITPLDTVIIVPEQPLDWIGQFHNGGVRYVLEHLDPKADLTGSDGGVGELGESYMLSVEAQYSDKPGWILESHMPGQLDKPGPDAVERREMLMTAGGLSPEGADACLKVLDTISQQRPVSELIAELNSQEAGAAAVLPARDLALLQGTAAVARHSLQLWAPAELGGEAYGWSGGVMERQRIDWGAVVRADVEAYLWSWGSKLAAIYASVREYIAQTS